MKISELKTRLTSLSDLRFSLPDGSQVPAHFHITEVGFNQKKFVDCGGGLHDERTAVAQIWVADDLDHRLAPANFLNILNMSEPLFEGEDLEIEFEFERETIGKYGLADGENGLRLVSKKTDCLAPIKCNIQRPKVKLDLSSLVAKRQNRCEPGGGCC